TAIANAPSVSGRIALIDRGNCNFTVKVKNAQNAGAVAVIIGNNVSGAPPGMTGVDGTIVIPSVSISQSDANTIRSKLGAPVNASILRDNTTSFSGTDGAGRVRMFAPATVQSGSS